MTVGVSKVDLIDQESHREGSGSAEVVILIADVDMLDVQLDSIEKRGQETETDGLLKL